MSSIRPLPFRSKRPSDCPWDDRPGCCHRALVTTTLSGAASQATRAATFTVSPQMSKGGRPDFVRVIAPDVLVFPDYDGNGMYKSLGNIRANPHVGLLFISFEERRRRIRVNGTANLSFDDPLLESFPGGQVLVRVTPEHIFPNCPRYIPKMQMVEASEYGPQEGCVPPEPEWKGPEGV
jgi:predicted pyridoxine 5'-phosphate oxidase superfamily flavin-nucleotide-binding protein